VPPSPPPLPSASALLESLLTIADLIDDVPGGLSFSIIIRKVSTKSSLLLPGMPAALHQDIPAAAASAADE